MTAKAVFRLASERWLVEGLDAEDLGRWARTARGRDPEDAADVRVTVRPAATSARKVGVTGPPGGAYRLAAEAFECEVPVSLDRVEVRGGRESLADGARAGVRLAALLRCLGRGGLALHASCVVRDGRAFVLAGPTGAGKTTAARHAAAAGAEVLADDIVLLRRDRDAPRWRASGLPWEADGELVSRGEPVRAAAIVRIRPAAEFAIERVRGARAAATVLACPPESLGVGTGRIVMAAARMVDELAVFRAGLPEGPEAAGRMLEEADRAIGGDVP